MSQRVVRYEGEGRARRPVYADEGPSSAAARDPIAMHANGGLPHLIVPTGGAGPVERRLISEAERAARREERPSPITARLHVVRPSSPPIHEGPVMTVTSPEAEPPVVTADTPNTRLRTLADAAMSAATAWTAREIAIEAWRTAQADLEAAIAAVSGPVTPVAVPPPSIPGPAPKQPSAQAGRSTAEQLQQSRRNGQAQMQAQRRAVELTSAAAAKAEPAAGGGSGSHAAVAAPDAGRTGRDGRRPNRGRQQARDQGGLALRVAEQAATAQRPDRAGASGTRLAASLT